MTTSWRVIIFSAVLTIGGSAVAPVRSDSVRDQEWIVPALRLPAVHSIADGRGVTVAVVDTGVDATHVDLIGNVLEGVDLSTGIPTGPGTTDVDGHGTAMASLIAGHGHGSDNGILGVAPAAKILPVRDGLHHGENLPAAVDWAVSNGADIISISEGQSTVDAALVSAVERAIRANVVVVASVGNSPDAQRVSFPAALPGVLAVAGTGKRGDHAAMSVTGPGVLIAAP